ncbi:MAG: hypothetical protein AAF581_14165 [Planctomycetota bacterium]
MVRTDHHGDGGGETYLRFSAQATSTAPETLFGELSGLDAHDHWAVPRRLREIIACRDVVAGDLGGLIRKEKHLLVYLLLAARPELRSVLELGSSLFEMIDGLEGARRALSESGIDDVAIDRLAFHGIEISPFLRRLAVELHPGHDIQHHADATTAVACDLLYDRVVSSLAFETTTELAALVNRSQVALLNLYLSCGDTFVSSWAGKPLTYFSLDDTVAQLDRPLFYLFGRKSPGPDLSHGQRVVEAFFLCATDDVAADFLALATKDPQVAAYFTEKDIVATPALELLTT